MVKKVGDFQLTINAGKFSSSQIIVMLGENGTGKTTLIKMLAGEEKHPEVISNILMSVNLSFRIQIPEMAVSYKPQHIRPKFQGTVKKLLETKLGDRYLYESFQKEVYRPLQIDAIIDNEVQQLSGNYPKILRQQAIFYNYRRRTTKSRVGFNAWKAS